MIYTIEKRHEFGYGTMTTHYEVKEYQERYDNGVLYGGKTKKVTKTKKEAEAYCREHNIQIEKVERN